MNLENWTQGVAVVTNRSVVVVEVDGSTWWQFIDSADEMDGVDPNEIAESLHGLLWNAEGVSLVAHWRTNKNHRSEFEGTFVEGQFELESQVKHFSPMSTLMRGDWADAWDDGNAELMPRQRLGSRRQLIAARSAEYRIKRESPGETQGLFLAKGVKSAVRRFCHSIVVRMDQMGCLYVTSSQ